MPTAFVTGASRGIGRACAEALARAGFDVAVSARTVTPGEAREHSSTVARSDTSPLPGSLQETAALVEAAGRTALLVPADLTDAASLGAAATLVLERWGTVDIVVHNGRYIGPGHMDRLLDTPIELIEKQIFANAIAPLILNQRFLPAMVAAGGGTIVNITSSSGYGDPTKPAGAGGWGVGYPMSKAAAHRITGVLQVEHGHQGIRAYNVQPGFINTERMAQDMGEFGFELIGAPPEVVGAVIAWVATDPDAEAYAGRTIEAQYLCHERGLLPGWAGPRPNTSAIAYDRSAATLEALEARLRASGT
ncbi:MAG: SDR family oxidoreductase [Actinobacteria bacterium]|nr:SDR family oxidoreductase [Actinomycetota bacterium]